MNFSKYVPRSLHSVFINYFTMIKYNGWNASGAMQTKYNFQLSTNP